ncbi:MAG: ABC transporter ATP-binding protein/permease [Lachnospiraceae bacterium]|nr:ABC transporter ATP-binding protein/permease [Lachnospiraceae bacterium]
MENTSSKPYFQAFYRGNRLLYAAIMIISVAADALPLALSINLGSLMDIAAGGTMSELIRSGVTLAVLLILYFIEESLVGRLRSRFLERAMHQYKETAFEQLTKKSISAFSKENTGRYLSVLTNDTASIEENYLSGSFDLVQYACLFMGTMCVLLWYNIPLTLLALVLCILPLAVMMLMGTELTVREERLSRQNESFVASLQDLLKGFSVIKSFKAEARVQDLFNRENGALEETRFQRSWYKKFLGASALSTSLLMQCGTMLAAVVLALRGSITIGTVVIFINNCNYLMQPIQMVPQLIAGRKAAAALVEKLAAVTEENMRDGGEVLAEGHEHDDEAAIPEEGGQGSGTEISDVNRRKMQESVTEISIDDRRKMDGTDAAGNFAGKIKLQNVSFCYNRDGGKADSKPALQNVSMEFLPGEKYALVGTSGSGKSTLLKLLMGSYDDYDGSVTLDGCELKKISADSLYDVMSLIGQEVFLFNDTIRNNITMFGDFPAERVDRAIEQAGLSELFRERGEDYLCGENGVGLSGGERQRISIARTLLRGTPVLLVDEATAALDAETAHSVTEAILKIPGITSVTVTHRLEESLLREYDKIFVMKDGLLAEQGVFEELMEKKGLLYSLYTVANA